jgi:exonuclease SbcC
VQHRLRKIKDIADKKDQLDQAVRQYDTAKTALTEREMRVQTLRDELHRLSDRIKSFEENAKEVDGIDRQLKSLRENRQALQKDVDQANRRLGAEQQKADRLKTMAATRPEIKALQQQAAKDQQVYEKLTVAFSKDGIPALIIENAIPEIEEEANRILSQLTGNRTQITIEPLRNLKTGGTKETLDIHISDELGTRPYEMFSGGEAFRINFALRIALSKLLAHRAGTRLRSLIIDEGFGTQDSQGLEYLVEALQSIQDDFEKIIVVTHLERLKNAFPARIEVIKHPDIGSLYEVVT